MTSGQKKELRDICQERFNRTLGDAQLELLWNLILIAPGPFWWKWTNLHQYITVALEGLDKHAPNDPNLSAWEDGGKSPPPYNGPTAHKIRFH